MARKPISGPDLSWIILEELRQDGMSPIGIAIVSGCKRLTGVSSWRLEVGTTCKGTARGGWRRSRKGCNPFTAWRTRIDLP